jgi:sugar phosphate isomerase/epimerase
MPLPGKTCTARWVAWLAVGFVSMGPWIDGRPLEAGPDAFLALVDSPAVATKSVMLPERVSKRLRSSRSSRSAAFPKGFMDQVCVTGTLSRLQWMALAMTVGVAGLELYPGCYTSLEQADRVPVRAALPPHHLLLPLLCASPDFTHPSLRARRVEIARAKHLGDLVACCDAPRPCRVLCGQGRAAISEDDGVALVVAWSEQLIPYAAERTVILARENHEKHNSWIYPDVARHLPVFRRLVEAIDSSWYGVNDDPSHAMLVGEDPLEVLDAITDRVVSMHVSDRRLLPGSTRDDMRAQQDSMGYARILQHGEMGTGLNAFPPIVRTRDAVGFSGWIAIEDGMKGMDELRRSVAFLRAAFAGRLK